jgi:ribosomal protein S27E
VRIKRYAQGKFCGIECPKGTTVVRRSEHPADGETVLHDHLVVPFKGQILNIPADPPELLPMLAESGNFGVTIVGEPEPDERLAGASCPGCGENDVNWLQVQDGSVTVHCDYCGADFAMPTIAQVSTSRRAGR